MRKNIIKNHASIFTTTAFVLFALISLYGYSIQGRHNIVEQDVGIVKKFTLVDDFTSMIAQKEKLVVMKFYANWCPHCRHMDPIDQKIAGLFSHEILFGEVDIDDKKFNDIFTQYKIVSVPTYLFFINGKPVKRINGSMELDEFKQYIEASLPKSKSIIQALIKLSLRLV